MSGPAFRAGVDLVDCDRMRQMLEEDPAFLEIAFTEREQADCSVDPARLGARWAAKEAVMKVLGKGIGAVSPRDIEIRSEPDGAPTLGLTGSAQHFGNEMGATDWSVSLSHEGGFAVAFVIATIGGRGV